jgi:acetyltransferase-like isoleucine patch superfamily enzyme
VRKVTLLYNDTCKAYFKARSLYLELPNTARLKPNQPVILAGGAVIEPYTFVSAGNYLTSMGAFSYCHSPVNKLVSQIGRYCSISRGLVFLGAHHPYQRLSTSSFTYDKKLPIFQDYLNQLPNREAFTAVEKEVGKVHTTIGHDVWIGQNVTLAPGVDLGTGCVVGANALVTKDVPPYAIVGGVPAKVIKYRFSEPVIERLLASEWWQYGFDVFGENQAFMDPIKVLDLLDRKRDEGTLHPFTPEPLIADDGLLHRIYGDDIPPQLQPR